jgi:hypothetical protein
MLVQNTPQINNIKQPLREYRLKTGFTITKEQKRKILNMPMDGIKATINQNTGELTIDIGKFMSNQLELIDYLITLFYEDQNGGAVNLDTITDEEYKECEKKLREINPFGVFNIKMN